MSHKPFKLCLAFRSHKYSVYFPFKLVVLPTEKTPCPCRRMVNYIKLGGGHGQGTLFCYDNKIPVKKLHLLSRSGHRSHGLGRQEHIAILLSYRYSHVAAKSGFFSKAMGRWHSDCYRKYIQVESIPSKTSTGHI